MYMTQSVAVGIGMDPTLLIGHLASSDITDMSMFIRHPHDHFDVVRAIM